MLLSTALSRWSSGPLDFLVYKFTGDWPVGNDPERGVFNFPSGLTAPGGSLSFKVGKGKGFELSTINNFSHSQQTKP
jgi:hypothetical protein